MQAEFKDNILVIQFDTVEPPCFKEVRSKDWVLFGENDNYIEERYLYWYNNSAKHNALINGKVTYIFGNGLISDDISAQQWMASVNDSGETLNDIMLKSIPDAELYGGFYWQLMPSLMGYKIYHMPYDKMRSNKDNSKFYYKADGDFKNRKDEVISFPSFSIGTRLPSIYFFKAYRPGNKTYPLPSYIGASNWIASDVEVGKHTFNNATGGFTGSKMINLFNGEPTDENKKDIEKRIKSKFTGSRGDRIMITFNMDPTKAPTILDMGASDLTKEDFTAVNNLIESNLLTGHGITSGMLFGVKTEGQLGGSTELQASYEIFKNTYANKKQQEFERIIKIFAEINGIYAPIKFQPLNPITVADVTNTGTPVTAEQMTNDAVKNLTGRQHQQLLRIIRQHSKGQLSSSQASTLLKSSLGLNDAEINSMLGSDEFSKDYSEDEVISMFEGAGEIRENFVSIKSKNVRFSSDKECLEDEFIVMRETFVDITTLDTRILSLIQKDKRITPEVIAKTLRIDVSYVNKKLTDYAERGLVNSTTSTIGQDVIIERDLTQPVGDIKPPDVKFPDISIKYSYEWNPEVSANQRDTKAHPSRAFCKKLMDLDRYYSRSEIEQISQRLGYSVWDRRGGFWNKGNGDISPTCRHIWRSNVLIKKK